MSAPAQDHGSALTAEHAQYLADHAVDPEFAASLGVRSITRPEELPTELAGHGEDVLPAICFPWTDPDGHPQPQLKVMADPLPTWLAERKGYVTVDKEHGYRPPLWELRKGPAADPVLIVEGTKQCLAVARYAPEKYSVYGIAGCTSWSENGQATPALKLVDTRDVVVMFDADRLTNPDVWDAAKALEAALISEGALEVKFADVPGSGSQGVGIDDLLGTRDEAERARYLGRVLDRAARRLKGDRPKPKLSVVADGTPLFGPDGALLVAKLADAVDDRHPVARTQEPGRLALYKAGCYRIAPEAYAGAVAELLGDEYRRAHAGEAESYTAGILYSRGERQLPERMPEPLLNVANGMLDLRSGQLLAHDPRYMSSVQLPIAWNPDATCPIYEKWLFKLLPDQALELEEASAQMLDPSRTPSKAIFNFGPSRSGKSTWLRILEAIVGPENHSAVSLHQLSDNRFAAAGIYGKILNSDADVKSAHVEDISLFKKMTGEDSIHADRKHGAIFRFRNRALFAFSANELPTVGESSRAYVSRIVPFHWAHSFIGHEDPRIEKAIMTELPGILVRLVRAWQRQHQRGGYAPVHPKVAERFERESDRVRMFLADRCRIVPVEGTDAPTGFQTITQITREFGRWAEDNGGSKMGQKPLTARLDSMPEVRLDVRGPRPARTRGTNIVMRDPGDWGVVTESDGDDGSEASDGSGATSAPESAPTHDAVTSADVRVGQVGQISHTVPSSETQHHCTRAESSDQRGVVSQAEHSGQNLPHLPQVAPATSLRLPPLVPLPPRSARPDAQPVTASAEPARHLQAVPDPAPCERCEAMTYAIGRPGKCIDHKETS